MTPRFLLRLLIALLPLAGHARTCAAEVLDITQLPLEQLLETEYIPASRIARQISDAPSAVSVVTAQDIRDFGYQSLSDILKSMRGLFVTYSTMYDFLGGRGVGGEQHDYAGRIMLMIDGYVTNDNVFNQIFIGEDGLLDVALIDRVEFIPGPGSTSYGNSAFTGVISVTTKRGKDLGGLQAAVGMGSRGKLRNRLTLGKQLENGAEYLISASAYQDHGESVRLASYDDVTGQQPLDFKEARNRRLFFKGSYRDWTLEFANNRQISEDSAVLDTMDMADLGKVATRIDDNAYLSLRHDGNLAKNLKVSSHFFYGQYEYTESRTILGERADYGTLGRWWGVDFKFVGTWFDHHKLLFGGEYRDDYEQHPWGNFYLDSYSDEFDTRTTSLYVQDDYRLSDRLSVIPGVRFDRSTFGGDAFSPRLALIYTPTSASTFKLSYGNAFRYSNRNENSPSSVIPPEHVATTEFVWQQQLGNQSRLTFSLYRNKIEDVVRKSYKQLETMGQELGYEYASSTNGLRLSGSLTHQRSRNDSDVVLVNSPEWLGKLNVSQRLFGNMAVAGFEVQMTGRREGYLAPIASDTVANLTVGSDRILPNGHVSISLRNLFNAPLDHLRDFSDNTLQMKGRDLWLQLEYTFR